MSWLLLSAEKALAKDFEKNCFFFFEMSTFWIKIRKKRIWTHCWVYNSLASVMKWVLRITCDYFTLSRELYESSRAVTRLTVYRTLQVKIIFGMTGVQKWSVFAIQRMDFDENWFPTRWMYVVWDPASERSGKFCGQSYGVAKILEKVENFRICWKSIGF